MRKEKTLNVKFVIKLLDKKETSVNSVHNKIKNFTCGICEQSFSLMSELMIHFVNRHEELCNLNYEIN